MQAIILPRSHALRGNVKSQDQWLTVHIPQRNLQYDHEDSTTMKYKTFGNTDMQLSEVGFGAWAIGGNSFGHVDKRDSLAALASAEHLGCNFVDTAAVYGNSEAILGEFLQGRRDKWFVATKFSGDKRGMTAVINEQLQRLKTDYIDFYQIHWVPNKTNYYLYDELNTLKQVGKVRYIGVSLYNVSDIDYVLKNTNIDGFQVAFSLLDPYPLLRRINQIRKHNMSVIVRSSLHNGFLTGKYNSASTFSDENDQRHKWPQDKISKTVQMAEQFRFLEQAHGSMAIAAARYPLSFPEVTTVVMSTKNATQADMNFGEVPREMLTTSELSEIHDTQKRLGLINIPVTRRVKERLLRLKEKYL